MCNVRPTISTLSNHWKQLVVFFFFYPHAYHTNLVAPTPAADTLPPAFPPRAHRYKNVKFSGPRGAGPSYGGWVRLDRVQGEREDRIAGGTAGTGAGNPRSEHN